MSRYKISKHVEAKNIKAASMMEPQALSIELDKPEEPTINTHAIGFHTGQEYSDEGI
jgi:hypothetical protein